MNDAIRKKVEQRAYELFLKRGGIHGYAIEDWAKAEKEVMAETSAPKQAAAVKPVQSFQVKKPQQQQKKR
jgi:hypothetical protein